jgi:hypothetical protein
MRRYERGEREYRKVLGDVSEQNEKSFIWNKAFIGIKF